MSKLNVVADNAFRIEKDVPLPGRKVGHGRPQKYPFDAMEVGDSFFIPGAKISLLGGPISRAVKRNPGTKWAGRKVNGGVRVWRVL